MVQSHTTYVSELADDPKETEKAGFLRTTSTNLYSLFW